MPLFHSNCMIVIMPIILLVKPQSIRNILKLFLVGCIRKKIQTYKRKKRIKKEKQEKKESRKDRERGKRREIKKERDERKRKTSVLKCNFNQLKKLSYSALNLWGNR